MTDDTTSRHWWNDYRQTVRAAESHRIEVYLRSLAPVGTHDAYHDILNRLDGLSTVDDVTVSIWGRRICQDETFTRTDVGRHLLDRIAQFEEWGSEYGASSSSFFEERDVSSSITETEFSVVVPPEMCLAIRTDSALAGVFPTEFGNESYSVMNFLDAAERELEDVSRVIEQ